MIVKRLFPFLFLTLLALSLTACGSGGLGGATPTPLPPLVGYEKAVFTVEKGPIVSTQDMTGDIVPSRQDELFFRSSGFTTRVTVKNGDFVKKGDVLAELQVDDILNQLEQAQIDLDVAQANLDKYVAQHAYDIAKAEADVVIAQKRLDIAQIDLNNSYGVDKDKAQLNFDILTQNLNTAQSNLTLVKEDNNPYMEQSVKRAELAVERLQALLGERQIVAAYDAVVLRVSVRPGQQIDAYYTAIVVGDPSELVVRSPIDYDLTGIINKDSDIKLYFTKDSEERYPVTYMPNFLPASQEESETSRTSSAFGQDYFYFSLPDGLPEDEVTVGRQVSLTLLLGQKDDALMLPPAAIREYRGLYFVIVQEGDRRRRVEINEIGLKTKDRWEVIADLAEGDQVLGP